MVRYRNMAALTKVCCVSVAALTLFNLGGCANCAKNPGQVRDPLCAAYNSEAGVYEKGDAEIEKEIISLEARRDLLEMKAAQLRDEAGRLEGERRSAARRLEQLNRDTAALNRRLSDLSRRSELDQEKLAELRQRERDLSRQVLDADTSTDEDEIRRLTAKKVELEAEIQELLEIS